MEENILQEKDFTKIVMTYQGDHNEKVTVKVALRYIDKKTCYFGFTLPVKYIKPKRKSTVEFAAYTNNGIYKTSTKLQNTNMSFNEMIFEVITPKTWEYTQRRIGSRKEIAIPLLIHYNDGFEIKVKSSDLSVGGLSFVVRQPIPDVYQRLSCSITLTFPKSILINFENDKLTVSAKILRCKDQGYGETYCACSFVALSPQDKETLKNYIMLYK